MKFIDLFAGIGGFHEGLKANGFECVLMAEKDKHALHTYTTNHKGNYTILDDVKHIVDRHYSNYDLLCAGFPCQPFSQAGLQRGFEDSNGNYFFDICKIIARDNPKYVLLENVKNLVSHDKGYTFKVILDSLEQLGYKVNYQILKTSDYGLPQNRSRIFIFATRENLHFTYPEKVKLETTMSDILGVKCEKDIGYTLRVGGRGSKIGDRHNWEFYNTEEGVIRITSKEAKILQGFKADFVFPVSERQAMKQLGNSVSVNIVDKLAKQIIKL